MISHFFTRPFFCVQLQILRSWVLPSVSEQARQPIAYTVHFWGLGGGFQGYGGQLRS